MRAGRLVSLNFFPIGDVASALLSETQRVYILFASPQIVIALSFANLVRSQFRYVNIILMRFLAENCMRDHLANFVYLSLQHFMHK